MQVNIVEPQMPSGVDSNVVMMTEGSSELGAGIYVGFRFLSAYPCSSATTPIRRANVY